MTTATIQNEQKRTRRRLVGVVDRGKADKTRRVKIEYMARHEKYGKYMRRRTVLAVHDEANLSGEGDRVEIISCRPISKTKRWKLVRVIERAPGTK